MSGRVGSITTDIIADGLVFNMDAANRASYIPDATTSFNTINLSESGSLENGTAFLQPPVSASCWDFDGIDDNINTNLTFNGSTNCAISLWINPTNVNARDQIYKSIGGTNNFAASFWNGSGGYLYVYIGGEYGVYSNLTAHVFGGDPSPGWVNLTIVYDGNFTDSDLATQNAGRLKVYWDGVYVPFNVSFPDTIPSSIPTTSTGMYLSNTIYEYDGQISCMQAYNRALSASEVLHNYNALKGRFGL
jgi:hypothetical protein